MSVYSLEAAFKRMPDTRRRSGRRHPLPAILMQATVAMLGGARSLEAIAQFGRDRGEPFARAVGCTRGRTPCKATFHNVFAAIDTERFEGVLSDWLRGRRAEAGWKAVSVDGKTLRGATGEKLPGVHLLAAYEHETRSAVGQMAVDARTNEHKAALDMLDVIDLGGAVVTGDAMFCQRDLSEKVVKKKGITSGRSRTISRS